MMNILLADDQVRVRFALRVLLEQRPDWKVVGEASEAAELLAQASGRDLDLVLVDGELPGLRDGDLERLRQRCPKVLIVVFGDDDQPGIGLQADALASKANPPEELLDTLQRCAGK